MDERQYRDSPVAPPSGPCMLPSDRMVIRRYNPLRHFESMLENGFRAAKADTYEKLEGRATPQTLQYEQENMQLEGFESLRGGGEPDFPKALYEARKAARHHFFVSCWRMGTPESIETWRDYADISDTQRNGIAFESTIGQMKQHLEPDEPLYMGVTWYQERDIEMTANFPFHRLYFFKDQKYDDDKEFRAIANRNGNPTLMVDGREWSTDWLPDDHPKAVSLKGDLDALTNHILIAPQASRNVEERVKDALSESSVNADVIRSQLEDGISSSRGYQADIVGPANYSQDGAPLDHAANCWLENTDYEKWPIADAVQLNQQGNRHPKRTLLELYRYSESPPDFSTYGQDHLGYQVHVWRFDEDGQKNSHRNVYAENFDETINDVSDYLISDDNTTYGS